MICNIIHVCVLLGTYFAEPQNSFDPGVGRYCITFIWKYLFGTGTIYFGILFSEKGKQISFSLGLICDSR